MISVCGANWWREVQWTSPSPWRKINKSPAKNAICDTFVYVGSKKDDMSNKCVILLHEKDVMYDK